MSAPVVYAVAYFERDGTVIRGKRKLTDEEAVARLRDRKDVVVCGGEDDAARHSKARALMTRAYTQCYWEPPHSLNGLPHFHPAGIGAPKHLHSLYEANGIQARTT